MRYGALRGSRIAQGAAALAMMSLGAAATSQPAKLSPDQAAAIALFEEARTLMDAKDFAAACPRLVESQKLAPALGTLLNLARCREGEGKTASAWAGYREVATFAEKAGQSARATVANERAAALEPTLSRVRIDVDQPPPGFMVQRDGAAVESALLGTAVPVDPGEHVIEASAPGYKTWSSKVVVGKQSDLQVVHVPPLERGPEPPPQPTSSASASPSVAPTALPTAQAGDSQGMPAMRLAGFITGGIGVAAIAVGAVLGGLATSDAQRLVEDPALCPQRVCTNKGYSALQTTTTEAWASTVGLAVGAAALAAGVVLIWRAPAASPGARAAVTLKAGPSGAGLHFTGSF